MDVRSPHYVLLQRMKRHRDVRVLFGSPSAGIGSPSESAPLPMGSPDILREAQPIAPQLTQAAMPQQVARQQQTAVSPQQQPITPQLVQAATPQQIARQQQTAVSQQQPSQPIVPAMPEVANRPDEPSADGRFVDRLSYVMRKHTKKVESGEFFEERQQLRTKTPSFLSAEQKKAVLHRQEETKKSRESYKRMSARPSVEKGNPVQRQTSLAMISEPFAPEKKSSRQVDSRQPSSAAQTDINRTAKQTAVSEPAFTNPVAPTVQRTTNDNASSKSNQTMLPSSPIASPQAQATQSPTASTPSATKPTQLQRTSDAPVASPAVMPSPTEVTNDLAMDAHRQPEIVPAIELSHTNSTPTTDAAVQRVVMETGGSSQTVVSTDSNQSISVPTPQASQAMDARRQADTTVQRATMETGGSSQTAVSTDSSQPISAPTPQTPSIAGEQFSVRTVSNPEQGADARNLQRIMREVAPAQETGSPIELVMPRRPPPKGARVQRRAKVEAKTPASTPATTNAVHTEIGDLPSDLWGLMGEEPPSATDAGSNQPSAQVSPVQRTAAAPQLPSPVQGGDGVVFDGGETAVSTNFVNTDTGWVESQPAASMNPTRPATTYSGQPIMARQAHVISSTPPAATNRSPAHDAPVHSPTINRTIQRSSPQATMSTPQTPPIAHATNSAQTIMSTPTFTPVNPAANNGDAGLGQTAVYQTAVQRTPSTPLNTPESSSTSMPDTLALAQSAFDRATVGYQPTHYETASYEPTAYQQNGNQPLMMRQVGENRTKTAVSTNPRQSISPQSFSQPVAIQRDDDDDGTMDSIKEVIEEGKETKQTAVDEQARRITMHARRSEAERFLDKPIEVQVKKPEDKGGQRVYAERVPFERLNRHSVELPPEAFVPEDDEEEEDATADVDINQLSRQVYEQIRRRLSEEREQRRARMP